jgi:DNA-binding CsgD family transcriptional regulator
MKNELKVLDEIFQLIAADATLADKELEKFKARYRSKNNSLLEAKSALLSEMITGELTPYAKRGFNHEKLLTSFIRAKAYDEAALVFLARAEQYFYNGNFKEGEKCLDELRTRLPDKISSGTEYNYLLRMADVYNVKKEYAQRLFSAMDGLAKMKADENKSNWWYTNYVGLCTVIADSQFRNSQFDEAWPYLQEALEIDSQQVLNTRTKTNLYHNIATYYSIKDDNKESIAWYEKAIALLKKENADHPNLIGLYYLISYCYYLLYYETPAKQKGARADIIGKMEAYLDHCEKIIAGLSSPIHVAHLKSSKSRLEFLKQNYAGAVRLLEESFPVHQKFNHLNGITEYYHIGNKVLFEWGLQTNDKKKLVKAYQQLDEYNKILRDNARKTTQAKLNAVRDHYELKQKQLNEQLMQQQLDALNKEVQLTTLSLQDKIQILDELKVYVHSLKKKELEIRQLSRAIVQKIDSVKITEQDKNRLQQKISENSRQLDRQLIAKHPSLTSLEISMCNLFKTGITDKELAKLYGQSYKSYEQHRFRIKKKMGLPREVNLVKYLVELGGQ